MGDVASSSLETGEISRAKPASVCLPSRPFRGESFGEESSGFCRVFVARNALFNIKNK